MKKLVSIIFSTLLISSVVFVSPSNAAVLDSSTSKGICQNEKSATAKILYKKKQTSNPEELYKMALKKQSFLSEEELDKFTNGKSYIQGDKKSKSNELVKLELNSLATSELIEVYEQDGVKTEVFSVTEFTEISQDDLIGTLAAEKDYGERVDETGGVKAYSTNNYNRTYDNGENSCIDLVSVTGGWTVYDSSIGVGTKSINYGQTGRRCGSGSGVTQNGPNLYPTGRSYSYAVPTSYVGVTLTADSTVVGHRSVATLTRNSSKWTLTLVNNVTN